MASLKLRTVTKTCGTYVRLFFRRADQGYLRRSKHGCSWQKNCSRKICSVANTLRKKSLKIYRALWRPPSLLVARRRLLAHAHLDLTRAALTAELFSESLVWSASCAALPRGRSYHAFSSACAHMILCSIRQCSNIIAGAASGCRNSGA